MPGQMVWTAQVWSDILAGLRAGYSRQAACAKVGVKYPTFQHWLSYGLPTRGLSNAEMMDEVMQAEREVEARALDVITGAWDHPDIRVATQNAQWFLERKFRGDWGTVDITKLALPRLLELYQNLTGEREDERPLSAQELKKQRMIATVEENAASGAIIDADPA